MVSLIRPRTADRGSLAVKPASHRAASSSGHGLPNGSASRSRDGKKAQPEPSAMKPWANQPWPLIETPSWTQQITHPALHIANEIAHIHNAMLRGLNAIYLQAPHVQQAKDIADLSFLVQSWSTWLLDHHSLKESTMLPGFEAVLGVPAGTLTLPCSHGPSTAAFHPDRDMTTTERRNGEGNEEPISFLLHRVYEYASATHKDPQEYDATTLCSLLAALADILVPHLIGQVGLLISMREMCFASATATSSSSGTNRRKNGDVPAPLPMPMATISRSASATKLPSPGSPSTSPPISPSSSTFSSAAASTTSASSSHSPRRVSLSLFPSPSTARPSPKNHAKTTSTGTSTSNSSSQPNNNNNNYPTPKTQRAMTDQEEARDRLAQARALLEADDRATRLTQVYLAAEARASAAMDRFVVPPMMVRLRDVTAATEFAALALSRSNMGMGMGMSAGMGMSVGVGVGVNMFGAGSGAAEWPRMSIPAVHAVADKLSPRHEGAWRFLPCDVWGRPRELPFLG
ncbi:hypothetical protein F4859DRAFT_477482 [Xylaria cf. heliscus]|nr:hypothetical protein F4859DRAFT_477482 [Xylaria cf. heliscus]